MTFMTDRRHPSPHVVTWELTRACALHCRHCRAEALRHRDPRELSLDAIQQVLEDLRRFAHRPIVVFTGGDPLERPDLPAIQRAAVDRGFHTAMAPSVTPRLTPEAIREWAERGIGSVSLSLDGASAAVHDAFRGQPGTFDATLLAALAIREAGMKLQINSSVGPHTAGELEAMGNLVKRLGVSSWEVFFVIPTGRARRSEQLSAKSIEDALCWLAAYRSRAPFRVTTVGAPQFRRVLHEMGYSVPEGPTVREAQGFMFISHTGEVFPSGYLPVSAGTVPASSAVELYQESPLFQALRNSDRLAGRCGTCAYARTCGGSRARAYAVAGDWAAEDPGCYSAVGA